MEKDIFEGIRSLLTGLNSDEYDFEFPIRQFNLVAQPPSRDARTPVPDRALCTGHMSRMVSPYLRHTR